MDDELQQMKNLGKTSALWLHASGIHSRADLRRLGAVNAYRAVRTRGFNVSKTLLYAIEGALEDQHLGDLSCERKKALEREVDTSAVAALRGI